MLDRLLTKRARVLRLSGAGEDEYGNPRATVETATEYAAWIAPLGGREDTHDRSTEISEWRIYLPAGADLEADDRVEIEGRTFDVVEPPVRAERPGRGTHHVEARLRWIRG